MILFGRPSSVPLLSLSYRTIWNLLLTNTTILNIGVASQLLTATTCYQFVQDVCLVVTPKLKSSILKPDKVNMLVFLCRKRDNINNPIMIVILVLNFIKLALCNHTFIFLLAKYYVVTIINCIMILKSDNNIVSKTPIPPSSNHTESGGGRNIGWLESSNIQVLYILVHFVGSNTSYIYAYILVVKNFLSKLTTSRDRPVKSTETRKG